MLKCDGACGDYDEQYHTGKVRVVNVQGWGQFNYCETAIKEDQRRGLVVTLVNPEDEGEIMQDDRFGKIEYKCINDYVHHIDILLKHITELEEQLKKYEPVKQKVPALFKPIESEV